MVPRRVSNGVPPGYSSDSNILGEFVGRIGNILKGELEKKRIYDFMCVNITRKLF